MSNQFEYYEQQEVFYPACPEEQLFVKKTFHEFIPGAQEHNRQSSAAPVYYCNANEMAFETAYQATKMETMDLITSTRPCTECSTIDSGSESEAVMQQPAPLPLPAYEDEDPYANEPPSPTGTADPWDNWSSGYQNSAVSLPGLSPCSPSDSVESVLTFNYQCVPQIPVALPAPIPSPSFEAVGSSMRLLIALLQSHMLITAVDIVPKKRNVLKIFSHETDVLTVLCSIMSMMDNAEFICGQPRLGRKESQIKLRFFDALPPDSTQICSSFSKKGKCKYNLCKNLHPRTCAAVITI